MVSKFTVLCLVIAEGGERLYYRCMHDPGV